MWSLRKQFNFEASHQLINHDGPCARLHGHSWVVIIEVTGHKLHPDGPKENMLMDYADMVKIVSATIEKLDHQHLNEVFSEPMPTSEYLAQKLFETWKPLLIPFEVQLRGVTIKETCTSSCRYSDRYSE
jgi:6-pyruvoyltetrahydropterin/6-carboxytetrahydropterin synthase